ncbi:DUF4145 domain-containing protein [Lelliottia amnigena]|uniref:DUF4145 domain-containing protein n=1 Tax=Lelliottia amnigena TaxID=61646 RepID=UPI0040566E8D
MRVHKISAAFYDGLQVEWPCPACGQMTLQILKESFVRKSTRSTRLNQAEDWYEPEHDVSVFSCMASCTRKQCQEVVACSGTSTVELDWDEQHSRDVYHYVNKPASFIPALHPFTIAEKCPEEIAEALEAAFSVFLVQPGAAANLIRISVEAMMTAMGVADRNDKDKRIFLHQRLENLPPIYVAYKEPLMAIKFLGNAGSHSFDGVKVSDIEDAFEIMEYVVNDLFSGRKESVEVLTRRLNDKFKGH